MLEFTLITFNSKILTIAAIGLMIYLGYLQRKESMPSNPNMQRDFEEAMGLNKSSSLLQVQFLLNVKLQFLVILFDIKNF